MRKGVLRLAVATMATVLTAGASHAECLIDDANDLKERVVAAISSAFTAQCQTLPASVLHFEYFGTWSSEDDQITAQQVFFVKNDTSGSSCIKLMVARIRNDAEKGVAPNCGIYRVTRAEWYPDADSGPSMLFYLEKKK